MFLLLQLNVIIKKSSASFFSYLKREKQIKRNMTSHIQIIGQNSPEGPPSLIVHYNSQRYLFNCREGTQRLCVQEKARLGKLSNIFLTRVNWECMGGLTGMLLTMTDAGVRNINIHGGKNLAHFIASTRHFVYRTNSTINVHELDNDSKPYSDNNLSITSVVVLPNAAKKRNYTQFSGSGSSSNESSASDNDDENFISRSSPMTQTEADAYRRKVISLMFTDTNKGEKPPGHTIEADCTPRTSKTAHPLSSANSVNKSAEKEHLFKSLPKVKPFPTAISYICQGVPLPRKFNKAAALRLGIKPGPIYGTLKNGASITLEDGRVITPDMVCDPEIPGHVFIVVDCPSVSYIDGLINSPKFEAFKKEGQYKVNVMIHYVGNDVLQDERYKEWLNSFDESTDHIFGSTELCAQTVQFTSHALSQVKLSMLNKDIFPIPKYSNIPELPLEKVNGLPKNSYSLENMLQYQLEPRRGIKYLDRLPFDHTNLLLPEIEKINKDKEYFEAVQLAHIEASKVNTTEEFPGDQVEIVTLGTGSSIPAKYRNVSATLVKIPGYGSIMLDAGEGTYGQMMRRFGIGLVDKEIKDIRCIFISHLHADHHLGVVQLLNKWNQLNKSSDSILTVVAPFIYKHWLKEYNCIEHLGLKQKLKFIKNESIVGNREPKGEDLKNLIQLKKQLGFSTIEPVEVVHCRWAYGLSIEHESGWKLVYSGDTRPCANLVEAGKDATLLIHEATLEDAEIDKAIAKRHSTTSEAVDIGEKMNARFTLLNHFSQRYPKLPILSEQHSNVCFSFDMMSILMKHMPILPKYTSAIQLAFKEEEEEEEINPVTIDTEKTSSRPVNQKKQKT
ncbi:beta-lactamase-like protein [Cokeromyces recurvatus]|uniref:beta-lactamase-like protein n=1 Tax=Cokeromyces recurvatus TaxID=90255 RepID=UPI00221FD44E|nr:beta-lactamase-like protein [Cokeromyces recurvatus]KAI7908336.1 beta-lactamase-like protein [Cokeromyces recurvatus]